MSATTTTPTLSASIVLDSIELIRENAQRVDLALCDYDQQCELRQRINANEGNDAEAERFRQLRIRTDRRINQARDLVDWAQAAFNDFASGRVSAQQTLENTMLAGEMLRLIDPAASKEQGA